MSCAETNSAARRMSGRRAGSALTLAIRRNSFNSSTKRAPFWSRKRSTGSKVDNPASLLVHR